METKTRFYQNSTLLLQEKIRLMKAYQAEREFWRIKGLFSNDIDITAIVETFREEYDPKFTFFGTPHGLYKKIVKWFKNNKD